MSLRAICGAASATKVMGPAAAQASGHQPDADDEVGDPGAVGSHAERACGVVTHLQHRQCGPERHERHDRHGEARRHRQHLRPVEAAQGALLPDGCGDRGVEVEFDDDPLVYRVQHRADADADDDHPVTGEPVAIGQRVDDDSGDEAADQRTRGDGVIPAADSGDHDECAGVGAGVDADDVGAAERIPGQRLKDRAGDAERGADQQRHQHPGHPPFQDDDAVERGIGSCEYTEDVERGHGVLADADRQDGNHHGAEQQVR